MKVTIEIEVYDECADPNHETGLTEEAYMELMNAGLPGDVIEIRKES